jgi:hypothetical protein
MPWGHPTPGTGRLKGVREPQQQTTNPARCRWPPMLILHWEDLPEDAIGSVEGVPVTKAARSMRDCAEAHLGPALLRQAVDDGQREGWLAARESEALRNELFGGRR